MNKTQKYIVLSQASLALFTLVCLTIEPRYFLEYDQGGVSNYGTLNATFIPYSLAFWGAGIFCALAWRSIAGGNARLLQLKRFLSILAVEYFAVALTTYPYKINNYFENIHILSAQILGLTCAAIGIYYGLLRLRDKWNIAFSGLMIAGFIISSITVLGFIAQLFTGEILFGVGFALVLIHSSSLIQSKVTEL